MSIKNALRRAASLLVELPPEEETPVPAVPSAGGSAPSSGGLDELLAALDDKGPNPIPIPGQGLTEHKVGEQKTVEQIVRDAPGPNLDQIKVNPDAAPITEDGSLDFTAIYQAAKLTPAAFGAEQILAMISSLPKELPLDVKRQTVKVSLSALGQSLGATPETLVADASRKLAALAAYEEGFTKETTQQISRAEQEITDLQAQIEQRRQAILDARTKQSHVSQRCHAEADRIDDVLEFFSLDVPPSKYAAS